MLVDLDVVAVRIASVRRFASVVRVASVKRLANAAKVVLVERIASALLRISAVLNASVEARKTGFYS